MTDERLMMIKTLKEKSKCMDDTLLIKDKIKKILYEDPDLFELLNNPELKDAPPEDYYNVNIFSYLKIPSVQSKVKNFICFDVNDVDENFRNNTLIIKRIMFRCITHEQDVATPYGIDRHDLLGFIIKDNFQWNNIFGTQWKLVYDGGRIAENGYYYREIHFEANAPTGLRNGLTKNARNNTVH